MTSRLAPSAAPSEVSSGSTSLRLSPFLMPRPTAITTSASPRSFSSSLASKARRLTRLSRSSASTGARMISPARPSTGAAGMVLRGRTVAICGRWSGHSMVAMMLPPMAGRVCKRFPVFSSMARSVQSAVSPACVMVAAKGISVRPVLVAPASMISGRWVSMRWVRHAAYGSGRKWASAASSTRRTLSAPRAIRPARSSSATCQPRRTAVRGVPRASANSRPRARSSWEIRWTRPSACSARIQTPS